MAQAQPIGETIAVRMFGPLSIRYGGGELGPRDLGGVKPKRLLEVLLLERGRTVPKDRMADLVWGDDLPQHVAATIETYMSVLRRRLHDVTRLGRRLIVTEHGGYRLVAELIESDVDRFESFLRIARSGELADRRAALEAATALGDGDLLADEPYAEWVLPLREHYRARQTQALIELAEVDLDLGDYPAALAASDRAVMLAPVSERAYRVAMLAHYALGSRNEALRAHTRCRTSLSEELGVDPTPETDELLMSILRGDDPIGLIGGGGEDVHPLRDLGATLPVAFADSGGTRIAYQVVGDGPVDLVFVPSFVTNLRATWEDPTYAAFLRRLASMTRLILFDNRGTGLSDPALDFPSTLQRSEDLLSVLDAAGTRRAVLFGVCAGGALCVQFAVDHPDRVAGLILHNSYGRMLCTDDYPWGWPPERYEGFLAGFEDAWMSLEEGIGRRNPGLLVNPRYRTWFGRYARLAASPWMARRLAERNAALDIRPLLPSIKAPCLVTCTTDDVWFAPDNSRYLAEHIANSKLVELPGVDHDPWVGEVEPIYEAVRDFVASIGHTCPRG